MSEIRIEGMKELIDKIRDLPIKLQRQLERGALRKALQPLKNAIESKAPVGETGRLADSIVIRTRTKKGALSGEVVVQAPHSHLVEFGHRMVSHSGREVGVVPPHPFARPALDETASEVLRIAANEVQAAYRKLESKGNV